MAIPRIEDDARTRFRRQCDSLGRARDPKTIAEQVAAFGGRVDRGLLEELWDEEEANSRRREKRLVQFRSRGVVIMGICGIASLALLLRGYLNGEEVGYTHTLPWIPFFLYWLGVHLIEGWADRSSFVLLGMARLILRLDPTTDDVGRLISISRLHARSAKQHEEIILTAIACLTRLLPAAVQTDQLQLDSHQRRILREHVVRVAHCLSQGNSKMAQFVYGAKPEAMLPEHADFIAAVLLALNALGELRGDGKEQRAARAAIQKLADAPAKADEPLNHRYVREVAKETLPLVQVGRSAP